MKKELAPSAHQKKFELAPFAPKKKSELAPSRDREAKIARCGAPRKTSGAGLVALRPRGLGQILPRKASTWPAAPLGGRRPEKLCGFGYGFARKKLARAPSTEKKKALGLALSVKKNSGLPRAKKKSSPLLKSKTVVLALFARGKWEQGAIEGVPLLLHPRF